ncbi:hypothetical protein ACQBJO_08195 [Janibacter sp. G349]|uniref:hypothetical protein n=1 Tax=Janibacter sp. G349 TaxID=3405424 RepID=UPI003B7F9867
MTTDEVRAMVGQGILSATPSGAGITVPSLNRAAGRHQQGSGRRPSPSAKGGSATTRKRRAASVEEAAAADRRRLSIFDLLDREDAEDARKIERMEARAADRRARGYPQPATA